jgi:hypothetical protein
MIYANLYVVRDADRAQIIETARITAHVNYTLFSRSGPYAAEAH